MNNHTHSIACLLRSRLLDYLTGALSGLALAAFYIGTVSALIAAAVFILAAATLFAIQAVRAVRINRIFHEEVDQQRARHDFADDLIPANHTPTTYDVTVGRDTYPGITLNRLTNLQLANDVPAYLAVEETGDTTVNGIRITWQPSTHTTGETR